VHPRPACIKGGNKHALIDDLLIHTQAFIEGIGSQGGAFCGIMFNSVYEVDDHLDPNRLEEYQRYVYRTR
jgi:hypothetical protein